MQLGIRLAFAFLAFLPLAHAEQRLSKNVLPLRYEIIWKIDPEKGTFSGEEKIEVTVSSETREISLHASGLNISEALVSQKQNTIPTQFKLDSENRIARLNMSRTVAPGNATIFLKWDSKIRDDLAGLYQTEQDGHPYILTQFYPADARSAFPCFDEPTFKARFSITLVIPQDLNAVSNGSVLSETEDAVRHTKTVRFSDTAPMSTYLLALAVGPYETIKTDVSKVPVGVWTPPGKKKLGQYALEVTRDVLPLLENYFGMSYPFEKLDLIVIPEFKYGAMENTAAIFFNETALLIDPNNATVEDLKGVADTIAHEISHQWFGDLVTMAWWDDLWLNESFADWLASKIVAIWKPEWKVSNYSVVPKTNAMKDDCLEFTHPIRVDIQEPEEADQVLDSITYSKGASFLRMLETWLGEERFRKGIQLYVKKHERGNTSASDLWQALEEASGQPVVHVGESWTDQAGFPVIHLLVNTTTDKITIAAQQKRCLSRTSSKREQLWQVPFCIRYGIEERQSEKCWLLSSEQATYELHPEFTPDWIYGNANEQGFYYVDYDSNSLTKLKDSLNQLTAPERAGLLASQWAATVNGSLPMQDFMSILAAYKGQTDTVVIQVLASILTAMDEVVVNEKAVLAWREFVQELFLPVWHEFGWTPASKETDDQKLKRALVLQTLAEIGRPKELISEHDKRLESYLKDSASLDPSLVAAVVHASAKFGNSARYTQFLERAEHSDNPQDSERFLYALPLFEKPELARKTFELAIHVRKPMTKDTSPHVLSLLFANRSVKKEIWNWTRNEWSEIHANFTPIFLGGLVRSTEKLCDQASRDELNSFLAETVREIPQGNRMLQQSLEKIDSCIQLARGQRDLEEWLNHRK